MSDEKKPLGYALLGCGSFGQFCLQQYAMMPEIKIVAVADRTEEIASKAGKPFGARVCSDLNELLRTPGIDLVHIATPPGMHYEPVMAALLAGKHVLCEKPLAISTDNAKDMLAAAATAGRVCVVNLIMRYDPICQVAGRILREKLLGEPVHAFFENYAGDEKLLPNHWFWDERAGGGIFVEHGVHFFDLFANWLGGGEVLAAAKLDRPGTEMTDQVQCLCRYGENVMTSFYHGFHRADRLEAQEFRIVCERGEMRLFEWLPTSMRIDASLSQDDADKIGRMMHSIRVTKAETYNGERRRIVSRHKPFEADGRFIITGDVGMTKGDLYGKVLRDLMQDQIRFIRDRNHRRILDESAGLTSLQMACRATELARQGT